MENNTDLLSQVSDLTPLAGLAQLQSLYCSTTQVNDLSPLAALTQLERLYCYSTKVTDFSPIQHLVDACLTVYK